MKTTFQGVSILSAGPALGHNLQIDDHSIAGVFDLVNGKTVSAYLTHAGAGTDRLGTEIGTFSNFRVDGSRLRADFAFLKAALEHDPQTCETLAELAQRDPETFGVSIVGKLERSWLLSDGGETLAVGDFERKAPGNAVHKFPSARFVDVKSADFVSWPAANIGLFSLLNERLEATRTELGTLTQERDTLLAELSRLRGAAEEINLMRGKVTALAQRLAEAEKFDMRKCGVAPHAFSNVDYSAAPKEGATDQQKWEQYHALSQTNPAAAEAFKKTHLTRK